MPTSAAGPISPSNEDLNDGYYATLGAAGTAIVPGGGFVVAWASTFAYLPPPNPRTSSVFAQRFDGTGAAQGTPVKVSETGYAVPAYPTLAPLGLLPDGGFVAIWNALPGPPAPGSYSAGRLFLRAFNADGTPKTNELRVSTEPSGDEPAAAIAVGANGDTLAVWSQASAGAPAVYARLFRP